MMTLLTGIAALGVASGLAAYAMQRKKERNLLFSVLGHKKRPDERSTELPACIKRYLKTVIDPGAPLESTGVVVTQTGAIRDNPSSPWKSFKAQQSYSSTTPAFVWSAKTDTYPIHVCDHYIEGKGKMRICLGPVPLSNREGTEMDLASLLRYASEMVYVPQFMASSQVTWKEIDEFNATMTIHDHGMTSDLKYTFGKDNLVQSVSGMRHKATHDGMKLCGWGGTYSDYKRFQNMLVPTKIIGYWTEEKLYHYIRITVHNIRFEV